MTVMDSANHKVETAQPKSFCIGWDVGGWNCDDNPRSRDAVVILDSTLTIMGKPWRGNLRKCICSAVATSDWLSALFDQCQAESPGPTASVTLAIDTPLGFSEEFVNLVSRLGCTESVSSSRTNRYLFRHTERRLFEQGFAPLSAVKDMIGSQATKGMHALAKFAPIVESCGVWTDGARLHVIETYPSACAKAEVLKMLLQSRKPLAYSDLDDARICALIANLFATERSALEGPDESAPCSEGWIWIPKSSS